MKRKRDIGRILVIVGTTLIVASLWLAAVPGAAHSHRASAAPAVRGGAASRLMLSGRVYEGPAGIEPPGSLPLASVRVELWGSNHEPDVGLLLSSTTTDSTGWYGLSVPESPVYEFYNIVERDPDTHYSVDASSVGGTKKDNNWIQYLYPLTGKTLTGNKFWDQPRVTRTPTPTRTTVPPTRTSTPTATTIPPTRTSTPTATTIPPTTTPTPTRTGIPSTPTATPTGTIIPPTATPTPTRTAIPSTPTPTRTIIPPTRTPTPTATGVPPTATWTPTLTIAPPTTTPTLTPIPPGECLDVLENGDFESGSLAPWGMSGAVELGPGRDSAHGAQLGGADNTGGELWQTLTTPDGASPVQLQFWWLAESEMDQPGDVLDVIIQYDGGAQRLQSVRALSPLGQWQAQVLDLSAFAGQTVAVTFLVNTDGEVPSTFRLDDVKLKACVGATVTPVASPSATALEQVFSGYVYQGPPGDLSHPWSEVHVGVFKARIHCEEGILMAEVATDALGAFQLRVPLDIEPSQATTLDNDGPYYNLIVMNPDIHVHAAESDSGGVFTNQGWLQFGNPHDELYAGNRFYGDLVYGQLVPAPVSADAHVNKHGALVNYGSASTLETAWITIGDPVHKHAFVFFDLYSLIPKTAQVTKATLSLYLQSGSGDEKVCMSLHRVMRSWQEKTITWSNQPNYAEWPAATHYVDKTVGWKSWDVTSLVQSWVVGTDANYGVAVVGPEEGKWWSRTFSSKEGAHPPLLEVYLVSATPFPTPTGTGTPTLTPTPTRTATPVSRQVQITAIEVNQAIQDINTTKVPLVAGKAAVVRVHLKVSDGKGSLNGVNGQATYGGGTFKPINSFGWMTVKANPSRAFFEDTLNFLIPASYAKGTGSLKVRVLAPTGYTFGGAKEMQSSKSLTFKTASPLKVVFVPVQYKVGNVWKKPPSSAMNDIRSWLKRAYPVPDVKALLHPTTLTYAGSPSNLCVEFGWIALDNQVATLHSTSSTTLGAGTYYYGMISNAYRSTCSTSMPVSGRANGIPSSDAAGTIMAWSEQTGELAGHELGHCLGLKHAECCGATGGNGPNWPYSNCKISPPDNSLYGIDIQNFSVKYPSFQDFMSYCPFVWLSDVTYMALGNAISGYGWAAAATEPQDVLLVSGWINYTAQLAELDPFYRMPLEMPERPAEGPCHIVLRDASQAVLAEYPFTPRPASEPSEEQDEVAAIHELVPDHPQVAHVEIRCDEQVLATRSASAHAPFVHVLSPNGGENWEGGMRAITWEAADEDGDALSFLVQVSGDAGNTWTTLATGLSDTVYEFDTMLLGGSQQALARVVASDGLLTAQDASDEVFNVAAKEPQVAIEWPADGSCFQPGQAIAFSGYAYDPEEGPLPGEALLWESDRDGTLGSGSELLLWNLSTGVHRIFLTALDSDGMESIASARVLIGYNVFLPIVMKGLPPQPLLFEDNFEGGEMAGWTPNFGTWMNPGDHLRGEFALGNAWNIKSVSAADVEYEGTLNLLSGNAVGLVLRSSADGTSSYDVILDAVDNVFKISKREPYQILASHSMTVQRNRPYRVRAVAHGNMIEAWLDGVQLLSVSDTTYASGQLGVMLFRATATYDDLVAFALP